MPVEGQGRQSFNVHFNSLIISQIILGPSNGDENQASSSVIQFSQTTPCESGRTPIAGNEFTPLPGGIETAISLGKKAPVCNAIVLVSSFQASFQA